MDSIRNTMLYVGLARIVDEKIFYEQSDIYFCERACLLYLVQIWMYNL